MPPCNKVFFCELMVHLKGGVWPEDPVVHILIHISKELVFNITKNGAEKPNKLVKFSLGGRGGVKPKWTGVSLWLDQSDQNPKPELVPSSLPSVPQSRFLHQLQTSITWSFIKLECFLRPFLKTRSHDKSAHTFRSSLQFLEVPQKVFFCAFFNHIFWHVWSYRIC